MSIDTVSRAVAPWFALLSFFVASAANAQPSVSSVAFDQIDWYGSQSSTLLDSEWGKFTADIGTAPSMWFVNVLANAGGSDAWVVRNLPTLPTSTGAPTQAFSTVFDLGLLGITRGTDLTSLDYLLTIDSTPRTTAPPAGSMTTVSVGTAVRDAEGKGPGAVPGSDPGAPPDLSVLDFTLGFIDFLWHLDVPNYDLDNGSSPGELNGCGPAAAANSMKWLGAPDDLGTIFDDMSDAMGRAAEDGVDDDEFLAGKLKYINDNDLPISVKFMDDSLGSADFTTADGTANSRGSIPDFDFIEQELADGEDVELGMTFYQCTECLEGLDESLACNLDSECDLFVIGDGLGDCEPVGDGCETNADCPGSDCESSSGHWTTLVGSLDIGLAQGVWTKDDADQDNAGGTETTWSWLRERGDGFLEVTGFARNQVDIVVSESPLALPSLGPLGLGLLGLSLGGGAVSLLRRTGSMRRH